MGENVSMALKILSVGMAGGIGTLSRLGLGALVKRWNTAQVFPWETVTINIVGCFLFGLIWAIAEEKIHHGADIRLLALGGFMGAFTTFSTYIFETGELLHKSEWLLAIGNLALQNTIGIICLFTGMIIGAFIIRHI